MSIDTFKPAKMSDKVGALIHLGQYLGFRGAIGRALKAHLGAARKGSPGDAMILANVFYSAAGNMLASGILYRPLAPLFLLVAKWSATKAFISQGKISSLLGSLSVVETGLRIEMPRYLGYGDIQILQSIFFQWGALGEMLNLDATQAKRVVRECGRIIEHSGEERLRILSYCILVNTYEEFSEGHNSTRSKIIAFIQKNYDKAMTAAVSKETAQVLCRACRAISHNTTAKEIARRYGLNDQLIKAKE